MTLPVWIYNITFCFSNTCISCVSEMQVFLCARRRKKTGRDR
ncbi:hypothetical protein BRYFOR_09604 [Marvinbryantia formatexigens DSM 14469]|uniref:Uncharacterized protein n=1 Tax=Marvinbryantia formatexigens DSM 14469 TaxID=478749 RepID=C6LLQ6_9FIRM|nr:hypothetical protein BRYFOR_09604 [Marvinbryantia formatexigens DSM 14469]